MIISISNHLATLWQFPYLEQIMVNASEREQITVMGNCDSQYSFSHMLSYLLYRDSVEIRQESTWHITDGDLHCCCPPAQVPPLYCQQGASLHRTPQGGDLTKTKWANEHGGRYNYTTCVISTIKYSSWENSMFAGWINAFFILITQH